MTQIATKQAIASSNQARFDASDRPSSELLGEGHLRTAVREFVHHHHEERPHEGLGNELIPPQTTVIGTGEKKCRERLGGLLKFYYREAA
jgi:hypothetical protein